MAIGDFNSVPIETYWDDNDIFVVNRKSGTKSLGLNGLVVYKNLSKNSRRKIKIEGGRGKRIKREIFSNENY
jgi:hypothetical protein